MSKPDDNRDLARQSRARAVHGSWLSNRITIEQAEAKHMVDIGAVADTSKAEQRRRAARLEFAHARGVARTGGPVPFGFLNPEWREMVASIQDGDELWEFKSVGQSWEHLAGRAGIALVRNGKIMDCIVTTMN